VRNVKSWLAFSGVLALSVFEVFLMAWAGRAIAGKMLEEIERHPELTAVWNTAANVLAAALVIAIIALLAWGTYETAIDTARFKRASALGARPSQRAGSRKRGETGARRGA
jgi:hypothetical protein